VASAPLLEIDGLKTTFGSAPHLVRAVDGIELVIEEGQTLGLVGESGSGKSVTSLSILRLLPENNARIEAGRIALLGGDLVKLPERQMRAVRGGQIGMIFQEPGTSLNPVFRVGRQVMEAIRIHQNVSRQVARDRALRLFEEVGIPDPLRRLDSYPHEMSGGQKQRVMIAMALSCNPRLLIADEPTTALDVTIQAQILELLRRLRDERGMSILFISHDLGVIGEIADRVAVMYRGKIVENAPVAELFENPRHPYTKGLLACRPKLASSLRRLRTVSDYMEMQAAPDGEIRIIERTPGEPADDEHGRLLHPRAFLEHSGRIPEKEHAGRIPEEAAEATFARFVPQGTRPLLQVADLKVHFPIRGGLLRGETGFVKAVDGISFDVYRGQTLGLVGESGCGKTTTGRAILRLVEPTSGTVRFDGVAFSSLKGRALRRLRRRIQIIFQDPYSSLNPRMTVEAMLTEPMRAHRLAGSRRERLDKVVALLEDVGLEATHLRRYPHEFSGGQRQRLGIARALAAEPEFIICDESVSALDVSVQAQVLNLLKDLQREHHLTYIFISHDLSVVKFMSDMMAVMNEGRIVEFGPSEDVYARPRDEYTRRLIAAIPEASLESILRRQAHRLAASQIRKANPSAGSKRSV
jgi:peptide/nickel transport system ATP-binding protein